jgi:REP element-mobilizing transposase RayT
MSRPLRIEIPGGIYHVTSRGNARGEIFLNDEDRERFLETLAWVVGRFGWVCHAYCLMDNHFHLLIETPLPNLSLGMRQLNGVYTQRFNRAHKRVGHLFQGRFKAILLERDSYLLELCRYIVLNPVRAQMVKSAGQYRWSSYLATVGEAPVQVGLSIDWVLAQFAKTRAVACKRYAIFVAEGIGVPSLWSELKGQVLLGGEKFVESMSPHLDEKVAISEVPKRQRLLHRPALQSFISGYKSKASRNLAMAKYHLEHGYTQAEIAAAFGLHYATVSRIIKAVEGEKE